MEPANVFTGTSCVDKCPERTDNAAFDGVNPNSRYDSEDCKFHLTLDFGRYCLPGIEGIKKFFESVKADKVGQYLADVYLAWKVLLIALGITFILALFYMVLLRLCAKILIWFTFIATIVLIEIGRAHV